MAVFVEGPSDRVPFRILLEKLGQSVRHVGVVRQGKMFDVDTMVARIEAVRRTHKGLSRILICRDSEGVTVQRTYGLTRCPERRLNSLIVRVPVHYVIVDHSIEGWLAWDLQAVTRVVGGSKGIAAISNPEENRRPAQLLSRVFSANGKSFNKVTHNQQIAELVDVRLINCKSPTFRRLVKLLRTP